MTRQGVFILVFVLWVVCVRSITMEYIDQIIAKGPYSANFTDIVNRYQPPKWYLDAKFGFYTHWLVSSVPAYGTEWYPRLMYDPTNGDNKEFISTYGPLTPTNGFKEFIPQFNAADFNPTDWMQLFQRAGAKYAGPVGEHHDGFALFNCSLSPYTAVLMGPKRDVVGELRAAADKLPQKMHFVVSSHRAWHFAFYNQGRKWPNSDVNQCQCPSWQDGPVDPTQTPKADPEYCDLYCPANPNEVNPTQAFMKDWLLRTCEMADLYLPALLYFDWWIGVSPLWQPYVEKMAAFYYNRLLMESQVGVINTKGTTMPVGADILDYERGQACTVQKRYWQTDTSISVYSWGYIKNDVYKQAPQLIASLVDIVSKNGGLLLNVGPPPNGTIPIAARETFEKMGDWLAMVGEAIYASRPYHNFGEGPTQVPCGSFTDDRNDFTKNDFRFTVNPDTSVLYVTCMGAVGGDELTVMNLGSGRLGQGSVKNIRLLGYSGQLTWKIDSAGLHVTLPTTLPTGTLPPVLGVYGMTDLQWDGIVRQGQDSTIKLDAATADQLNGGVNLDVAGTYLTASNWGKTSSIRWTVRVVHGGIFHVQVMAASPVHARTARISAQGTTIEITMPETASATTFSLSADNGLNLKAAPLVEIVLTVVDPAPTTDAPSGLQVAYISLDPDMPGETR